MTDDQEAAIREVRRKVVAMLDERQRIESTTARPSRYWTDFCSFFDYLIDLSPRSFAKLRLHTYHLTGDNYQTYYFGDRAAFLNYWGPWLSTDGLPPSRILSEPDDGIGFRLDDGRFVSQDIARFQRSVSTLSKAGLLDPRPRPAQVVEIGGGYGGLALSLSKILDGSRYVIVDLPEVLLFSAAYLTLHGRELGSGPLAQYSVSYRLMMLPITNLTQVANRVLLPTYARLQEDVAAFRRSFLKATRLMSLVAAPAMVLLIAFAKPLIVGGLGKQWHDAVVPTQVLAVVAIMQTQTSLVTPAIVAFGRSKWQLYWSLISDVPDRGRLRHHGPQAASTRCASATPSSTSSACRCRSPSSASSAGSLCVTGSGRSHPGLGIAAIFLVDRCDHRERVGDGRACRTWSTPWAAASLRWSSASLAVRVLMPKSLLEIVSLVSRDKPKSKPEATGRCARHRQLNRWPD